MAAAIRIKLADLLKILSEQPPSACRRSTTQKHPLVEKDIEIIRQHLQSGPIGRRDLELELNMSRSAILHRLDLLKERGIIVDLPDHHYGLRELAQ